MGYTNAIGSPQQVFDATEAAASTSANRLAKAEPSLTLVSGAVQAGPGSAGAVDRANLSAAAGVMAQALSGSDVRTGIIAALQQSIAAGTYTVSSSAVADRMISAMMQ